MSITEQTTSSCFEIPLEHVPEKDQKPFFNKVNNHNKQDLVKDEVDQHPENNTLLTDFLSPSQSNMVGKSPNV